LGHAGFLKIKPTFGQQPLQNTFLHEGHCQDASLNNPPIDFPHEPQKPLGISFVTLERFTDV
jgi:hypothetical protein